MTKMNPEIKAKWVAALRSGKYKQGVNALCADDHFCCLGVLCDISGLTTWVPSGIPRKLQYDGMGGMPPISVWKWATGSDAYPSLRVVIGDIELSLDSHNDEGRTFAEIADAIEAQL